MEKFTPAQLKEMLRKTINKNSPLRFIVGKLIDLVTIPPNNNIARWHVSKHPDNFDLTVIEQKDIVTGFIGGKYSIAEFIGTDTTNLEHFKILSELTNTNI